MKKIIFSNYDDINNPYYAGGGAYAIHEIAKRLSKHHQVLVITGKYKNSKNRKVDGVSYKRIGVAFGGPKIGQLIFQSFLPYYVMTLKYNVWFESFTPPISTGFLQFFTKKPVVGLVHMLSGEDMKRKYKIPFEQIERIGIKTYKYFIVMSENYIDKIRSINKEANIYCIPNGVEIPKYKNTPKKNQILFIGRIEVDQKGLDLLLNAFKKVVKKQNLKLVIAGSGEKKQLEIIKNIIQKLNLENNVLLAGRVKGEEKEKLIQESKCLVIPSRFETFSLTALEGLAAGMNLVVFNIPGLSWIPENLRLTAKKIDANSLSEKIEDSLTKRKNEKAIQFAKKFTWKKTENSYLKFVEGLNG